jgi:hypothetical protein
MVSTMATLVETHAQLVLGYLADRNRQRRGAWVSLADIGSNLGIDWEQTEEACGVLGDSELAEFMGGFPLRPTRDHFTLVRLTPKGESATRSG